MLFYTVGQSRVFVALMAAGLVLGALYDIFRRLKKLLAAGRALSAFIDLLFSLALVFTLAISLFFANRLELRLYALMGAACGAALYLCAVAPALDFVGRLIKKVINRIGHIHGLRQMFQFFCK